MLLTAASLAWTALAAITDLRSHRILNWNTYSGIVTALLIRSAEGSEVFLEGLTGLLACGSIMLLCFVLFDVGGGDVKLLAMLGAFLGLQQGIEVMLWTFTIGCATAVTLLIWRTGFWRLLRGVAAHLGLLWKGKAWVPLTEQERHPLQTTLYLAPAALVAVLFVTGDRWIRFFEDMQIVR